MDLIKFRRQYLITSQKVPLLENWQKETFNNMNVYAEQALQMNKRTIDGKEFLLLGYWINPHEPDKSNEEILDDIFEKCQSIDTVYIYIYILSGRFALFCRFGEKMYGISDAGGFRPIFFTNQTQELHLTSNIFLLKYVMNLEEKKEKYQFEHTDVYRLNPTYGWCPGYTFYRNVESLSINHYLDIVARKTYRFYPNKNLEKLVSIKSVYENLENIAKLLKSSIMSLVKHQNTSFSLTAGYDSRLLLSATKDVADRIHFWISYDSKKQADYFIPQKLLTDLGYKHFPIKNSVLKYMKYKNFYVNNTPMAHDLWCKFYTSMFGNYPDNSTVIRGANAATFKMWYYKDGIPEYNFWKTHKHFTDFAAISTLKEVVDKYVSLLREVCDKYGYNYLDLLISEYRDGGQWQTQSQLESDFLHDVFVPLSNREIIDLFLQLPDEYRDPKEMKAYKEIIKIGWPELLNYPFNPPSKYSKFELKMQYYKEAAKFKLKKMFEK